MFSSFLLSFREGLEAALIIGIILTYLSQMKQKELMKVVYSGSIIGALVSVMIGIFGFEKVRAFEGVQKDLFEGILMLVAAGLIVYFIVWMGNKQMNITASIKEKVQKNTNQIGLFLLSFLSVFREGLELVVFNMTKVNEHATSLMYGSIIGIAGAIVIAVLLFKTAVRFNLKLIFKGLGVVLVIVGAEMFAEGVQKLTIQSEVLEFGLMFFFILFSLVFFFKQDIRKWKEMH